jgi:trk system potassium uptake protein TrkH
MHFTAVQRVIGLLLTLFSLTMLPPLAVSLYVDDGQLQAFWMPFVITLAAGVLVWLPARGVARELRVRDGFLVAATFWLGLGAFGALPLLLTHHPEMSLTEAVFETVSGLTTTGVTTLTGLDGLPRSILYYRAQLQWFGGMGVIVLAVAVLPILGVGGMQLYRAETPGPLKDSKLTPRITETAKALWYVYLGLTLACTAAYWLAGMGSFDALTHAFATVATGGFSTHDDSMAWFNSPVLEGIAILFMFLSAINFALHFVAWRRLSPRTYWRDVELRAFLGIVSALVIVMAVSLWVAGEYPDLLTSIRFAAFQVVSFITTTGFVTGTYAEWPGALPLMLILIGFIGGCGGSTAGGMKVMRWQLLYVQGVREIRLLVHPHAQVPVRLGSTVVGQRVIEAVWGFCVAYIILFGFLLVLLVASGMDQVSAFSALATCINNMGPGLGTVNVDFSSVSATAKWICTLAMLLGRLEVFTLLVLVSPSFWRT